MIEPFSILAGAVTTYIIPKALEKVGEKLGETAIIKSHDVIKATQKTVQTKLQSVGIESLLVRAVEKPTETNVQILQAELVNQMEEDQAFAVQLQELINQIQTQSPSLQSVLEDVRVKGSVNLGNIKQASSGRAAQQIIGKNLGVGGDLKIGDVIQEN